ncbi:MAG: hypothetical protein FKY71_10805 [Spiribacter salinus]|uniref:PEP-CTERM sorting domain-containing protein n=1 Tax=Spiribacter salinus TaxID=1335746 RepID=A0A540VQH8_9GAMM|nr:MAG: hypothetical protein FKY71_10805 [Spiribacter salinus]
MIRDILTAAVASSALFAAASAGAASINFDAFSYTGTVTPFASEEDARNGTDPLSGPHTIPT